MPTELVPAPRQLEQVFADLARCLYLYQSIELHLKVLLPHLHMPGEDLSAPGQGFKSWGVLLNSKDTLGLLIKRLAERTKSDDRALLEREWRKVVEHRNEVVHQFAGQPFVRFESQEHYVAAVEFLRVRHLHALPMLKFLEEFAKTFVSELQTSAANRHAPNPRPDLS